MAEPKLTDFKVEIEWDTKALEEAFASLTQTAPKLQQALDAYGASLSQLGPLSDTVLHQPALPGMEPSWWHDLEQRQRRQRRKRAAPKPKVAAPEHNHVTARRKIDLE